MDSFNLSRANLWDSFSQNYISRVSFKLYCIMKINLNYDHASSTPKERLDLVCFYKSALGQAIYSQRRISIEPLIEHIKAVFRIDPLPARGFSMISAIVLLSVLLYQLMVYYNCKKENSNPKSIKYMLGTI